MPQLLTCGQQTKRGPEGPPGGRLQFGMVADFKSERRPGSNRNPRPDCVGIRNDFENEDFSGAYDHKRIVADAEKAFVSLLKPEYNVVKFASHPKGADGLYGSDFVRYGYAICEAISFNTAHGRIRGSRDAATGFITNDADSIFVEGSTVKLFVSGVGFPAEPPPAAANAAQQGNQKEHDQGGRMRPIAVRNGTGGSRTFMRLALCSTTSTKARMPGATISAASNKRRRLSARSW